MSFRDVAVYWACIDHLCLAGIHSASMALCCIERQSFTNARTSCSAPRLCDYADQSLQLMTLSIFSTISES
ncbi:hypothetical protein KPH14_008536 [Odynerus spinipes]|uniref:Uncharacterized protein n=1 Tax=Odynerus spinipes TaxID=1348599 RepID=A0AAD9RS82_9HYME|nr:hypothetical protein KPH14_008536 [Odynerus spinipes]